MRYQFIENHRDTFAVRRMCKVLAVFQVDIMLGENDQLAS